MRRALRVVLALAASAVGLLAAPLAAQRAPADERLSRFPEPTGVIIASIGSEDANLERLAVMVEEQLRNGGYRLRSMFDAAIEVDRMYSMPQKAEPALIERLAQNAEKALMDVAAGEDRAAERLAERTLAEAKPFLWHIGQLPRAASDFANICLYKVRALDHRGQKQAARQQALTCLKMVPDIVAEPRLHPDEIRDYLREIRLRLNGERVPGASRIAPGADVIIKTGKGVPPNCNIHINGRPLGMAPQMRFTLAAGAYHIHVACEGYQSRLTHLELAPGEKRSITLQAAFADHLITRPRPGFVYPSPADFRAHHLDFARQMAAVLRVSSLLVARTGDARSAYVDYYSFSLARGTVQHEATAQLPYYRGAVTPHNVAAVVAALQTKRSAIIAGGEVTAPLAVSPAPVGGASLHEASAGAPADSADGWLTFAQWSLLAVGVAGFGLSWLAYVMALDKQNQIADGAVNPEREALVDDRNQAAMWALLGAGAGAAFASASLALLAWHSGDGVAWWSWALGGLGAGLIALGSVVWAMHDSCDRAPCSAQSLGVPMGPMLMMQGLPLVTLPVVQLVRPAQQIERGNQAAQRLKWYALPWWRRTGAGVGIWMSM